VNRFDEPDALFTDHYAGGCSGVAASWCPVCGSCTCPRREYPDPGGRPGEVLAENPDCPLHGSLSDHAARG